MRDLNNMPKPQKRISTHIYNLSKTELSQFIGFMKSIGYEMVPNETLDRRAIKSEERKRTLKCAICPPNKMENRKRQPKHKTKPKGKDHR